LGPSFAQKTHKKLVPETWRLTLRKKLFFSFQSNANDEFAPAIFTAIYVTRKMKENKRKRTLAGKEK